MLKTMVFFSDVPDGQIYHCGTIEYEGRFWLVPYWRKSPAGEWRTPARIIPLDQFVCQDLREGNGSVAFSLPQGISKGLFDGAASEQAKAAAIGCIENPEDIQLPIPGAAH
jgi:hypothetical protein